MTVPPNADYGARHPNAAVHSDDCHSTECPCYLAGVRDGKTAALKAANGSETDWRAFAADYVSGDTERTAADGHPLTRSGRDPRDPMNPWPRTASPNDGSVSR